MIVPRPQPGDAAPYAFSYINLIEKDPLAALEEQLQEPLLTAISEERSQYRYAPGKWSIRQVLNHVTDTERAFAFRVLWFSRGFASPIASYDQEVAAAGAKADAITWAALAEEFLHVRRSTICLFKNMPAEGWACSGIASDHRVTVRALAFMIPGHFAHHLAMIRERYM